MNDLLPRMRIAGRIAASTLEMIAAHVKPGVTTNHLNDLCHEYMVKHGAIPAPLGYQGAAKSPFPKSICTSPNHVVCHGIPDDKPIKDGDILNIDVSLSKDGAFADTCKMFLVGNVSVMGQRVVKCAQEAIYKGIAIAHPARTLREIGSVIEKHAKTYGYSVVRDFCGHGIGEKLHQLPQVLHYDDPKAPHTPLIAGMTFTIEPMVNVGGFDTKVLGDGWTVLTKDRSLSAQFEHTIVVTDNGPEILTLRDEENLQLILGTGA